MLLDLFFLLFTRENGVLTEIAVELELLEHAETVALLEHQVSLERLETSIVIAVLQQAQAIVGGQFEIVNVVQEAPVTTAVITHTELPTTNDRSLSVELLEPVVAIEIPAGELSVEVLEGAMTTIAIEVIDLLED